MYEESLEAQKKANRQLRVKLYKKDKEIEKLKNEIQAMKAKVDSYNAAMAEKAAENYELQVKYDSERYAFVCACKERDDALMHMDEIREDADKTCEVYRSDITRLQGQVDILRDEKDKLEDRSDKVFKELYREKCNSQYYKDKSEILEKDLEEAKAACYDDFKKEFMDDLAKTDPRDIKCFIMDVTARALFVDHTGEDTDGDGRSYSEDGNSCTYTYKYSKDGNWYRKE